MEAYCNSCIDADSRSDRSTKKQKIVDYPLPRWMKWWRFYHTINNPYYQPISTKPKRSTYVNYKPKHIGKRDNDVATAVEHIVNIKSILEKKIYSFGSIP